MLAVSSLLIHGKHGYHVLKSTLVLCNLYNYNIDEGRQVLFMFRYKTVDNLW